MAANNMKDTKTSSSSLSSHQDDILDSFLTTIESKLRGPFSSLDLAKAVTTTALRTTALRRSSQLENTSSSSSAKGDDNDPAKEYLQNLSSVFSRTNKVIQCRMLIGLLGLNDIKNETNDDNEINSNISTSDGGAKYLTPEILNILHQTQQGPLHEEWVRTTSGLIEGVMFRTKNKNTRESCRSKEATKIIVTTGTGVCKNVEKQIEKCCQPYYTKGVKKQSQKYLSGMVDNDDNDNDSDKDSKKPPTSTRTVNKRTRGFKIEKTISSSSSQSSSKNKSMKQAPILNGKKNEQQQVPGSDLLAPTPDLNAAFAPYRYRLISTPILNTIVPEFDIHKNNKNSNCHFHVNSDADILQVDLQLEAQRAKDHSAGVGGSAKASSTMVNNNNNNNKNGAKNNNNSHKSSKRTFPPGFRPAKLVPTTTSGAMSGSKRKADTTASSSSSSSSNLFMPKRKKSSNLFNTTTKFRPQPVKTMLRRKGGGAQGLLKTGNASGGGAILSKLGNTGSGGSGVGGGGSGGSTTVARGSGRFSGNKRDAGRGIKSKMKMIDVNDVDILSKQRSAAGANNTKMSVGKLEKLRASKREQILKKGRTSAPPPPVAVAVVAAKNQINSSSPPRPVVKQRLELATTVAAVAPQQQQEDIESWHSLLRDRSNKMSVDDKARGERFFTTNQTERSQLEEGVSVYKIKIHEQRGKDPSTQQEIKETFYLELDYNTGEQKQSRKVKRY